MQAGLIRTLFISIRAWSYTLWTCILLIYYSYHKSTTRQKTNEILRHWSHHLLNQIGLSFKIIQHDHIEFKPGNRYILMSNHGSLYDIPLIYLTFPLTIRMVTKIELFRIPLFGAALKKSEFISIDRKNRYRAIEDLARAKQKMEEGITLWISPEGTRSRDGTLGRFKKGGFITAIQAGAVIIPFGIRGAREVLPPTTMRLQLNQQAEIHIGTPIDASLYSLDEKEKLLAETEKQIRELAGL